MSRPAWAQRVAEQLFLVVGVGRSGTSLLQAILAAHPDATMPNELGWWTVVPRTARPGEDLLATAFHHPRIAGSPAREDAVRDLDGMDPDDWELCFLGLLEDVRRVAGVGRVGEKSPGNLGHLDELADRFDQARFIHVVRDPRAVVASQLRAPFASRAVTSIARRWQHGVAPHFRWEQQLGDRYLLVRYEELVAEPSRMINRVCDHLKLAFAPEMLAPERRAAGRHFLPEQTSHMSGSTEPVYVSSIERWREELTSSQVAAIEHLTSDGMSALGYQRLTTSRPRGLTAQRALDNVRDVTFRLRRRFDGVRR